MQTLRMGCGSQWQGDRHAFRNELGVSSRVYYTWVTRRGVFASPTLKLCLRREPGRLTIAEKPFDLGESVRASSSRGDVACGGCLTCRGRRVNRNTETRDCRSLTRSTPRAGVDTQFGPRLAETSSVPRVRVVGAGAPFVHMQPRGDRAPRLGGFLSRYEYRDLLLDPAISAQRSRAQTTTTDDMSAPSRPRG